MLERGKNPEGSYVVVIAPLLCNPEGTTKVEGRGHFACFGLSNGLLPHIMAAVPRVPSYPDYDRGPHLAAVYIAGCVVSLGFVGMRLTARFSIAGVGIDDWCMLITWVRSSPISCPVAADTDIV